MNKGITIWEQHVEKLVLGVCVILLLGAAAMFVLDMPNTTRVGSEDLQPSEVNDVIRTKVGDLRSRLSSDSARDVETLAQVQAASADSFLERLEGSVSPRSRLPRIAPAFAAMLLPEEAGSADVLYYEPVIASPVIRPRVVQTQDTIEESELIRVPDLAVLLGEDSLDIVWTTPVAEVDLASLRAELSAEETLANPVRLQIPSNWYRERPYILDVVFERQEQRSDGSWERSTVLPIVAGARSIRSKIAEDEKIDAGFRDDVFMYLDDPVVQQEILQPDFYATLNSRFTPPTSGDEVLVEIDEEDSAISEEEADRRRRVREFTRRLRDRMISLNRTKDILKELGGELEEAGEEGGSSGRGEKGRGRGRSGGGPPGGDPNGGPGGPGGGFGGKKGQGGANSEAQKKKRIGLTKKVRKIEADIARIQADLAQLDPAVSAAIAESSVPVTQMLDTSADDTVLVWTHDLGVKQGSTYRYRTTVMVFNPLFARGRQLLESQRPRSEEFELASFASEWSMPVTIDPPVQFFFVRASDDGGSLGLGEAIVELYRYNDGKQRATRSRVQPGEPIGGPEVLNGHRVDFGTSWYLVDVIADPAASGSNRLDSNNDSIVVCRQLDGTEIRIHVPSAQLRAPARTRLEMDAREAETRG